MQNTSPIKHVIHWASIYNSILVYHIILNQWSDYVFQVCKI